MKKQHLFVSLATIAFVFLFSSCKKQAGSGKPTKTYTIYTPVYEDKAAVLGRINGSALEAVSHAGKIYIKDNYIFLNDVNKGIHVYDNSNPAAPRQIAFLAIPGNLDIAIKGNTLYADMYNDMLALDITNMRQARITKTIENLFTGRSYVNGHSVNDNGKIAAAWLERDTTVEIDESQPFPNGCDFCAFDGGVVTMNAAGVKSSGTAGSMAGMVLMGDYMYAITEMHSVGIVDISNPSQPNVANNFFAGFDLETIFPFNGKIFLGSSVGMFMYDVTDPQNPVSLGEFTHGRACDPVITDGQYAYVTLHSGDGCGGESNELHVIDVRALPVSSLVKTYQLNKPTGLSKDGNLLFVCDNTEVKVYNATDPANLLLLKKIPAIEPYDVITVNNRAMVVCSNGLYQYDYSNLNNVRQLSFLPVKK